MQVEYGDRPLLAETAQSDVEQDDADMPEIDEEDQEDEAGADDVEGDGEEQEGDAEETEGVDGAASKKAKRPAKTRQSLSEKQLGTTIFPMARIKKLIKADKELENMSTEATFMIAVATEYFVKHFMEEGYTRARLDNRKLITYKDMASLVSRSPEFDFLQDVVPMPMSLSEALEARKAKQIRDENPEAEDPTSTSTRPSHSDSTKEATSNGTGSNNHTGPSTNGIHVEGVHTDSALVVTTNPLFPGAIMKKGGHSHHRASTGGRASDVHTQQAGETEGVEPTSASGRGTRGSTSRNGQTSPAMPTHSIGTRRSGRRSMITADQEPATAAAAPPVAVEAGVAVVDDDVPME